MDIEQQQQVHIWKPYGKYWILFGLVVIIDIVAFVLPLVSYFKMQNITNLNDNVYEQYGKMQLKDIVVLKQNGQKLDSCPKGYKDLFMYDFQGLDSFYLCMFDIIKDEDDEQDQHCREFYDLDLQQFTVMKLGSENIRVCGQYFEKNIQLKSSCESNEVQCSNISYSETYVCAKNLEECPINEIQINEIQSNPQLFEFKFNRQVDNKMPLLSFKVVEGDVKCRQPNVSSLDNTREYHKLFKRSNSKEKCQSNHLFYQIFETNEGDLFDVNDMGYLFEINDFNMRKEQIYSGVVSHQIPWNPKYENLYKQYVEWWDKGRVYQQSLQLFIAIFNILVCAVIVLMSLKSSNKFENIKICFRVVQIIVLWYLFFDSVFKYRQLFKEILNKSRLTHQQIIIDVEQTKQFYTSYIYLIDTSAAVTITIALLLAVLQKWYYRKLFTKNKGDQQQLETFQPFFDDQI